jgi:HK97 family phage major capsid protein
MPDALEPEVVKELTSYLDEYHKLNKSGFATQEQFNQINKAITDALATANAAQTAQTALSTQLAALGPELETKLTRIVRERTARPPGLGDGETDVRTLGQRFADTEAFKNSLTQANGLSRSSRLTLTTPGRIRPTMEQRAITQAGSGYVFLPQRVAILTPPTLPLVVRDLLTVVPLTSGNSVEYLLENWTYAADYQVLEGDKKAEGTVAYTEKTASCKTIAWFVKASKQMIADAPWFASTVDSQLIYGVMKKEDTELLWGNNAAGHLHGLMPQATDLPADVLPGIDNGLDLMASAVAYLASLGYIATGFVLNPLDWAGLQIAKTAQGVYLLGGPPVAGATPTLWGLPVVVSAAMTQGQFLCGAFPPNATLFDRESPSVEIAYENEDDFVRNMVTIRAEERIALAVFRPTAFVKAQIPPPVIPFTATAGNGGKEVKHTK